MTNKNDEAPTKEPLTSKKKENALDLVIAAGPAGIIITLLKQAGISGLIPTLLSIFILALISRKIREKKNIKATGSLIVIWTLIDLGIFIVIPAIILIIFSI